MKYVCVVLALLLTAGLVLGCTSKDEVESPADNAAPVYAYTEQDEYKFGEVVTFGVANDWIESVEFSNGAPWTIEKNVSGKWVAVESHLATMELWTLEPGETREWRWVAETQEGFPEVTWGEYRVVFQSSVGELVAEFNIT